jgi:hypothetical protein
MRMSVTRKAATKTWKTADTCSHNASTPNIDGEDSSGYSLSLVPETEDARARIQKLLVTGDNRLKQGVGAEKVRATYEEALAVARAAGLEESVRPLVEVRLADLERLARGSPPPEKPAA